MTQGRGTGIHSFRLYSFGYTGISPHLFSIFFLLSSLLFVSPLFSLLCSSYSTDPRETAFAALSLIPSFSSTSTWFPNMLDPDKVSLLSLPPDIPLFWLSKLRMFCNSKYYIDECELCGEVRRLKAEALCMHPYKLQSFRYTGITPHLFSLCSFISPLCLTSPLSPLVLIPLYRSAENAFPALSSMPSFLHILHSLDLDHWILMVSTSLHFCSTFFIYVMYFFYIHPLCIGLLAFFQSTVQQELVHQHAWPGQVCLSSLFFILHLSPVSPLPFPFLSFTTVHSLLGFI